MDYKYSNKYFKDTGLVAKIGLFTLIGGIVLFIIVAIITHPMPAIFTSGWFIIAGLIMLIFGKGGNMTDSEYDEQTVKMTARILDKAMNRFEIEEKHIKIISPIILKGYQFKDEEGYLFKKGNDGKYRSNNYSTTVMMFGPQQMYLYVYSLSTTDEDNPEKEIMEKYKYLDLEGAAINNKNIKLKIRDKEENVNFSMFELTKNGGELLVSSPSQNDAIMDSNIADINKYILKVKKQAEAANQ